MAAASPPPAVIAPGVILPNTLAPADKEMMLPASSAAAVLLLEYCIRFFSKAGRNLGSLDFEYILDSSPMNRDDISG